MADLTDDPRDPRLTHGPDHAPTPQADAYLILSDADRARGFVRPLRTAYVHVGPGGSEVDPTNPALHGRTVSAVTGEPACGRETTMSREIAETYAVDPHFYGATYCVGCRMHLPVHEFVWSDDGEVVGS
jgi:hypothetical protein